MVSSAQVSFLALTSRKNTIEGELNHNALVKDSLVREMNKVSQEYQNALNTKTLKWSNNNGVTYQDLSYANLMTPSAMNNYKPYVITDNTDRVVIASNYKKYAEMISENGAAGGDYQSNRTQILSELLGINSSTLDSSAQYDKNISSCQAVLDNLNAEKTKTIDPIKKQFTKNNTADLLEKIGKSTNGKSWKSLYSGSDEKVKVGNASGMQALGNQLKALAKYFPDIKTEDFEKGVEEAMQGSITSINNGDKLPDSGMISGSKGSYSVDVVQFVEYVLTTVGAQKVTSTNGYASGKNNFEWIDVDLEAYTDWQEISKDWNIRYENAQKAYDNAVAAKNQIFTADQESKIEFYDALFTAMADNGWTYNANINDNSYLNEMFQNGMYSLTTMEKSVYASGQNKDGSAKFNYEYSTGIAENDTHVYKVTDSDTKDIALAEYESKKRTISQKETRIDNRNNNLQTELSALQQMMEGLDQVGKDNLERTMNWCG